MKLDGVSVDLNSDAVWNKGTPEAELPPGWWQMEMCMDAQSLHAMSDCCLFVCCL